MKQLLTCAMLLTGVVTAGFAQRPQQSPAAETSVTINGKTISIKYHAPSLRGRTDIFGPSGPIAKDSTYPVWRAGANEATSLTTTGDLDINGLHVPAGSYTLFVALNNGHWELVVSKQTGQWGLDYDKSKDLGRTAMTMSKPGSKVETYKMALSSKGGNRGELRLEWENTAASVPFTVK
jgi:hypothetical protein